MVSRRTAAKRIFTIWLAPSLARLLSLCRPSFLVGVRMCTWCLRSRKMVYIRRSLYLPFLLKFYDVTAQNVAFDVHGRWGMECVTTFCRHRQNKTGKSNVRRSRSLSNFSLVLIVSVSVLPIITHTTDINMKLSSAFLLLAPAAAFTPGASFSRSSALFSSPAVETETKVRA